MRRRRASWSGHDGPDDDDGRQSGPPVTPVKDPLVGTGDAMGRAADRVQDVCRACQGRLGVDDPCFGVELRTQRRDVLRSAQGGGARNEAYA